MTEDFYNHILNTFIWIKICQLGLSEPRLSSRRFIFSHLLYYKMDRFQNLRQVPFSYSQVNEQSNSNIFSKKNYEGSRFYESGVRGDNNKNIFADLSLAKSGFYSSTSLQDSTVRGPGRGLGNLPEDRIRKIAKDFVALYGKNGQIPNIGLSRIQREAYEQVAQKPQFSEQSIKQLQKTMDQNMDGRVTQEDIASLCRRYLTCEKRPITYTPMVLERLAVARRLFNQFDVEKKGYLTEKQVPNLLSQTYRSLGKTFSATEQDVKSWMKLADGDGDGHVTFDQYEKSIIRALKKQGIKIYQQ